MWKKWWKPEDSPQVSCSSASCTGGYLLKRHGFQKFSSKQLHINNPGIPNSFKFQYRSEHPWTLVFWTTPFRRVQTFQTTWNYIGSSGHTLFCQRFFSQLLLHQHVCAIITGGIRPYNKKIWEMFPMVEDMKKLDLKTWSWVWLLLGFTAEITCKPNKSMTNNWPSGSCATTFSAALKRSTAAGHVCRE